MKKLTLTCGVIALSFAAIAFGKVLFVPCGTDPNACADKINMHSGVTAITPVTAPQSSENGYLVVTSYS